MKTSPYTSGLSSGLSVVAALALAPAALAQTEITLWYHGAGNETESSILQGIIDDFNGSQSDYSVLLESFPQASYNDSVAAAAAAGNLPDIIDVDGPIMPGWAWAGYMQPLNLSEGVLEGFLPGAVGVYNDQIYSVGLWDAAVALVTRESTLNDANIRIPTLDNPWDGAEFMAALRTLQSTGNYKHALDLGMAWTGEWFPYAFGPFMQSFGGDMVDRDGYQTAEGVMNGEEAIAFGNMWQTLFEENLVSPVSQDGADRDSGFLNGEYALQWNGNWAALPILEAFEDALFLPAPDFGTGSKIGAASWQFGISATSQNPEGANAFIEFALQDRYLAEFSNGIGLIPATATAAAMTENYASGGGLEVFFGLSQAQAYLRPVFPGYAVAAKVFEKALTDIANGADVEDTLDAAADEISDDIAANSGYM